MRDFVHAAGEAQTTVFWFSFAKESNLPSQPTVALADKKNSNHEGTKNTKDFTNEAQGAVSIMEIAASHFVTASCSSCLRGSYSFLLAHQ